jgi:hypothetical protein
MTRYVKKNQFDNFGEIKQQRFPRKIRGHKFGTSSADKLERRHGWGYAKRRALLTE